jgi:hypothetical protein
MSNWVTITADNLAEYQAGKIILAARTKALNTGQPDPFLAVMPDVIKQMRDDIAENPLNAISATANTIPPSLRQVAILLTIEAMQARLPGVEIQDELATLISDAKKRMLRIANGKPVEQPTDPESPRTVESSSPTAAIIGDRPRVTERSVLASI